MSTDLKTEAMQRLTDAGAALSNCAYNLAQHVGRALTTRDTAALDELRRAWDTALAALAATSAPADPNAIADHICNDVAELGDRNSPEDWPEAMLVTHAELRAIVLDALATSAPSEPKYHDSTPHLHVGDSAFEDWYQAYCVNPPANPKQAARDAYAAGMGDPLVCAAPAVRTFDDRLQLARLAEAEAKMRNPPPLQWEDGEGPAQPEQMPYVSAIDPVMQRHAQPEAPDYFSLMSDLRYGIESLSTMSPSYDRKEYAARLIQKIDGVSTVAPEPTLLDVMQKSGFVVDTPKPQPEVPAVLRNAEWWRQAPPPAYEHPAAKRCRERFEAEHAELSDVMIAANCWRHTMEAFRDHFNRDRETPTTEQDVDAARNQLHAAIRRHVALSIPPAAEVEERRELSDEEIHRVYWAAYERSGYGAGDDAAINFAVLEVARHFFAKSKEKAS